MSRGNVLVWDQFAGVESVSPEIVAKTRVVIESKKCANVAEMPKPVPAGAGMFYGSHPLMQQFRDTLPKIASCDVPVLIQGETGTGKEVLARHIHNLSPRTHKPFIKLNCAAVPAELAESELFGYERGAFTGAFQRKPGIFEMANGGTVMLDEIGDMDFRLQAKLLQVLQDQEFRRVGGTETVKVDVRVIAATHRDLKKAGRENTFRMDLFYRLNGFSLTVPSLRDRRDDVIELAEFLYQKHSRDDEAMPMSPELELAMRVYSWPGNIREMETTVRKLAVLRDPDMIAAEIRANAEEEEFGEPFPVAAPVNVIESASRAKEQTESAAIHSALQATKWNRKQAADMLGLDYKALLYKMKKLGIG